MDITPEFIKDISVQVVKDFIDNKVPLSEGIAKQAAQLELEPEQIRRVVETCNTVTYLSLQKEASDRTFEFPLADYNSVLGIMCVPTKSDGTVTEAEFVEGIDKQASEEHTYQPDEQTLRAWAVKEYLKNHENIVKLAHDKAELLMNIGDAADKFKRELMPLEKLAEVSDEVTFIKLATLIGKDPKTKLTSYVFKQAELASARNLVELLKQAEDLVSKHAKCEELEKRAAAGALSGALGKGIGGAIGATAGGAAKAVSRTLKGARKVKITALDIGLTALHEPKPERNIWDNLQGSKRRFSNV